MSDRTITCITRDEMVEKVKDHINHILRQNLYEMNLNETQLQRLEQQKRELRLYLKRAGTGDSVAKAFVVDVIRESLQKLYFREEKMLGQTYLFSDTGQKNVEN